ncbi:MAG: hypothetical protein ACJ8FY_05395 [Gemmataceae bacterium]
MIGKHTKFAEELLFVRPTTLGLVMAMLTDVWPGKEAVADFGVNSWKHYEALYFPIREAEIMPIALDAALGDGPMLTELVRDAASNPHKDVEFHTSRDLSLGRESSRTAETIGLDDLRHSATNTRDADKELVRQHDRGDLER